MPNQILNSTKMDPKSGCKKITKTNKVIYIPDTIKCRTRYISICLNEKYLAKIKIITILTNSIG